MLNKPKKSDTRTICSLQSNTELVSLFSLVTVKEVSEALRVSRDTVYRLLDNRKLPFHMIGGCKRIAISDLQNYLIANKVQAHK
jgi:excisionase family DNA binding protein